MFRLFQKWHAKVGAFAVLFVTGLIISGIALNHSSELGLNKRYIQSALLLDLYQIKPAKEPLAFKLENDWITQVGERVYFNDIEIIKDVSSLLGAIKLEDLIVVAHDSRLTLLTGKGERVEELTGAEGVPAGMKVIGVDEQDSVVIQASHGYYKVNLDELNWNEFRHLDAQWSNDTALPEQLKSELLEKYRGSGLSFERVLLDLHSGRIIGKWGVYFVDVIAILLLILAMTGLYMWWTRK